jgi:hypothetical protein
VVELPEFQRRAKAVMADGERQAAITWIAANPEAGISLGGGLRKVRWEDSRRGKVKRGGLWVIYYYLTTDHQIWFFTLYDKDEATDLTSGEKKVLKQAIQAELKARRNRP